MCSCIVFAFPAEQEVSRRGERHQRAAARIESRRIVGMRSRISVGVESGGARQIVSPTGGSALPASPTRRLPRSCSYP